MMPIERPMYVSIYKLIDFIYRPYLSSLVIALIYRLYQDALEFCGGGFIRVAEQTCFWPEISIWTNVYGLSMRIEIDVDRLGMSLLFQDFPCLQIPKIEVKLCHVHPCLFAQFLELSLDFQVSCFCHGFGSLGNPMICKHIDYVEIYYC